MARSLYGCLISGLMVAGITVAAAQPAPSPNAKPDNPATMPKAGEQSGTAPGNEGSTGWTGGTGKASTGTSESGPTPGSKTSHPETATGLNPTASGNAPTR